MFVELAEMLAEGDKLNFTMVALKDGLLSLTVVPQGDFSKQPALGAGLSLQATPQEFDAELPAVLTKFVKSRRSLIEQIDAQTVVLDAAKAVVVADTSKAVAKAQGAGKPVIAPPKAGAAQAAVKVTPAASGSEGAAAATPAASDAEVELF